MPDLYTYTKYFQPSKVYDKSFTKKVIKAIDNLNRELEDTPLKQTQFKGSEWVPPYHKPYLNKYNNIIYAFAKLIKVKVMYKDILDIYNEPMKSLLFIGEFRRVKIMNWVTDYYFRGMFSYDQWIKVNLKEEATRHDTHDIRQYASQLVKEQLDILYKHIKSILVEDLKYKNRLENYIMGQYKLDYKKYKTDDHIYSHAVNTYYHHRRMLL